MSAYEIGAREPFKRRVKIHELDMSLFKKFSLSSNDFSIDVTFTTKQNLFFKNMDIVVFKNINHPIFDNKNLGNIFAIDEFSFTITRNKRKILNTICFQIRKLEKSSSLYLIYNLKIGEIEPDKLLEKITNETSWVREEIQDWIGYYKEDIHHRYDDMIPTLLLLRKING
jgi:hypothetical protein